MKIKSINAKDIVFLSFFVGIIAFILLVYLSHFLSPYIKARLHFVFFYIVIGCYFYGAKHAINLIVGNIEGQRKAPFIRALLYALAFFIILIMLSDNWSKAGGYREHIRFTERKEYRRF